MTDSAETAETAGLNGRVLILELDSVRQAQRFAEAAHPREAIREITGMIRTALLVSERITVTDSMLIDGIYFAHMPPAALADALGVSPDDLPLTVLSKSPTLADAVRAKRRDRHFIWQVPRELRRAHLNAWSEVGTTVDMQQMAGLAPFAPPSPNWQRTLSPVATRHLAKARALSARSAFYALSDRAASAHPEDDGVRAIRTWWETAYLVAIAEGNHADWLRFDAPNAGSDGLDPHAQRGRRRVHVSTAMTTLARDATPPVFGTMRYTTTRQRAALMAKPTRWRMDNLRYALAQVTSTHSRGWALSGAGLRLIVALAAIGTAIPGLDGMVRGWDLAWIGFGVVIASTIPIDAVRTLWSASKPGEAVLSVLVEQEGAV